MEIAESIYEGVVEPSYKKLPGQMPTVLVTADKREEKLPISGLAPVRTISLATAEKGIYIARREIQKSVSSTSPEILQKNVRSWETSKLSTLRVGLLRTTGAAPYPGNFLTGIMKTTPSLTMQWVKFY